MKKLLLIIPISLALAIFFYPTTSNSNNGGSPGGKSGSPNDNSNCTGCHNSNTGNNASISSNIPASGYVPEQTYTITATVNQSGINKFGFELTAEENNTSSAKTGTFYITNSSETKSVNNNTAVSHKGSGTAGTNNSRTWTMDWKAPSAGNIGGVTFYGGFIAANGNNNDNGDTFHATTLTVNEANTNTINNLVLNKNFTFNNNTKSIIANSPISLYSINGKLVKSSKQKTTNISDLKQGIYIIKSEHKTQKIILN